MSVVIKVREYLFKTLNTISLSLLIMLVLSPSQVYAQGFCGEEIVDMVIMLDRTRSVSSGNLQIEEDAAIALLQTFIDNNAGHSAGLGRFGDSDPDPSTGCFFLMEIIPGLPMRKYSKV